jgi:transforming growth factor-beta-induced protein
MKKVVRLAGMALLTSALILTGCSKNELADTLPAQVDVDKKLDAFIENLEAEAFKYASERPEEYGGDLSKSNQYLRFSILREAIRSTGLVPAVVGGGITILCPNNQAFLDLGINVNNVTEVDDLTNILLYHVIGGTVFSGDLSNGYVPTLNGAAVNITLPGGGHIIEFPRVNDAEIFIFDAQKYGTVFHGISQVLLPPTQNIVEIAIGANPEFSILVDALVQTGLDQVLLTDGPFTVFAPTNQAFIDLGIDLGTLSNEDLTNILLYHVVQGARVYSSDLSTGPVTMANGGQIGINASNFTISDSGSSDSAGLILSLVDIQGTNGVIHAIDKVLLP